MNKGFPSSKATKFSSLKHQNYKLLKGHNLPQ